MGFHVLMLITQVGILFVFIYQVLVLLLFCCCYFSEAVFLYGEKTGGVVVVG
jgi:hypothetical protein